MKTKILILYVYGLSAAVCFMMYFAPSDPAAGGIPEEAIRIRVVAHDNSRSEQERKERVHFAVAEQISKWAANAHSPGEARTLIGENIKEVKEIAVKTADGAPVNVSLGKEAFPAKQYGRYVYPPGDYESLVVTIGDGRGDNWWCLLYPSFCFPEEKEEDSGYKWAVIELWDHLKEDDDSKEREKALAMQEDLDLLCEKVKENPQSSTQLYTIGDKLYTYCE
ncbi:stage II sporulation protein R [Domibacillus indicus]|uniref:stage II sporulation protein R n=1 Tax=Domibacillus indicus TaxID=1437523 RepID=UPI00203CC647|nr:stage II sporulation protein R [Domibacillus indicus]MCM3788815.1 stage II sporulation protein R [Domibacillus indicus]